MDLLIKKLQKLSDRLCLSSDKQSYLKALSQRPYCEDTFHVVDLSSLISSLDLWKQALPRVMPYYAVKTNPDPLILATLAFLGARFDCASQQEMEMVLKLDVPASHLIFSHPRKPISHLTYAVEHGVPLYTFDSLEELEKLQTLSPHGNLLLRIKTHDAHSACPLSSKFGAKLEESYTILDAAFARNAPLVGIAFHVGSNCTHLPTYRSALLDAAKLFTYSQKKWGRSLSVLNLGGGWPGTDDTTFCNIAALVSEIVGEHFSPDVICIAEPGRFFATKTTTLAMHVIGTAQTQHGQLRKMIYYMSSGTFGFFASSLYYHYDFGQILQEGWKFYPLVTPPHSQLYPSLLWGPTCDSGDKIIDHLLLPELKTGDILLTDHIGAYAACLQTSFNGLPPSEPYYLLSQSQV